MIPEVVGAGREGANWNEVHGGCGDGADCLVGDLEVLVEVEAVLVAVKADELGAGVVDEGLGDARNRQGEGRVRRHSHGGVLYLERAGSRDVAVDAL